MKYAISDIHGCYETLLALMKQINPTKDDVFYFLGDYIDRGKDSKKVIDFILNDVPNRHMLMGNHEWMMLNGYDSNNTDFELWMINGGLQTLKSFNGDALSIIPKHYISLVQQFPSIIHLSEENLYLVHAGIDTSLENPLLTDLQTLLWERKWQPNQHKVVCGHTPQTVEQIKKNITTNKICIDGGCVYKKYPEYGNLVALELDTMELIIQPNVETK